MLLLFLTNKICTVQSIEQGNIDFSGLYCLPDGMHCLWYVSTPPEYHFLTGWETDSDWWPIFTKPAPCSLGMFSLLYMLLTFNLFSFFTVQTVVSASSLQFLCVNFLFEFLVQSSILWLVHYDASEHCFAVQSITSPQLLWWYSWAVFQH